MSHTGECTAGIMTHRIWRMWAQCKGSQATRCTEGITPMEPSKYLGQIEAVHEGALCLAFHTLDVLYG